MMRHRQKSLNLAFYCPTVSENAVGLDKLAVDMVKALRDATDESMPTPSVKSVDTEVGRLDHMRHGSSEVAALHGPAGRVHGSHVSVLANSSMSEQLATDFSELLRDAADASTPRPSVLVMQGTLR